MLAWDDGSGRRFAKLVEIARLQDRLLFSEPQQTEPDYLNALHEHYSPKLTAAIEAWKTISADPTRRVGKTVKQALVIWLRQNANKFGLTKEDGNPNEQGIEEVAKIANWDAKGGAPKTPC